MKYKKSYTVKEWKKFRKSYDAAIVGNDYQFFNFFTQRYESYDFLTGQEVLLKKYDIVLTDHKNKFKAGKMVKVPLKEKLKTIPSKITMPNINKGIDTFNKSVQDFGKSMDQLTNELGSTNKNQTPLWSKKKNINAIPSVNELIWGKKKVFGNWKAQPKRKKRKTKTQDQKNLEKLWGKKY